ncbi:hypothetical protein EA146_24950 [Enterobacter hormaechei]|nr:hypothetical protein EA146_24950 [Enterobacter hormaechei]
MMSLWDALRMNMMISYQELVRTFLRFSPFCSDIFLSIASSTTSVSSLIYPMKKSRDLRGASMASPNNLFF